VLNFGFRRIFHILDQFLGVLGFFIDYEVYLLDILQVDVAVFLVMVEEEVGFYENMYHWEEVGFYENMYHCELLRG